MPRWGMAEMTDPTPARSQVSGAVLSAVRGGLRILGGMVQVAAGVTKLLAVTALKAAEAAEAVVEGGGRRRGPRAGAGPETSVTAA